MASSASWVLLLCGAMSGGERTLSGEVWCRWDTWGRLIASHTSSFPWAVIEGNHEEEVSTAAPALEVIYATNSAQEKCLSVLLSAKMSSEVQCLL